MNYSYIFGTVLFTVFGQLIIKWRIGLHGSLPESFLSKFLFLLKLFTDPYLLSGFFSAFLASLCWMAAMTKFSLNHAYPFMGLNFVLILLLSGLLFHEAITSLKVIGIILVVTGIIIGSQG